jgi:hypothetical protein
LRGWLFEVLVLSGTYGPLELEITLAVGIGKTVPVTSRS